MNTLSIQEQSQVLSLLCEGTSIRTTERLTGIHRDTIMRLVVRTGEHAQMILNEKMNNLAVEQLQCDELHCFVGKRQKNLTPEEAQDQYYGEQYVFLPMCAKSKLIPTFRVGKRTAQTARSLMMELSTRITTRFQLSTDAFPAYLDTVQRVWGTDVDYAQVVKHYDEDMSGTRRYAPPRIIRTTILPLIGKPKRKHCSTSYIERQNLNMRMDLRRLTRLTNGYSKKWENLRAMLAIYIYFHNFGKVHLSLRVTPAMEKGLTKHIWSWEEMLSYKSQRIAA